MTLRERHHEEHAPALGAPTPRGTDSLADAERLLALGADAIDRALSQDSAAFLAANRQEGGE